MLPTLQLILIYNNKMNKQAIIFTLLASVSLPTLLQAQTSNNSMLTETIEAYIKKEEGGFFDNTKYKTAECS
jgi:hypothetical protein